MRAVRRLLFSALAVLVSAGAARADTMPQLDFGDQKNGQLLVAQVVWGALIFAGFYLLVSRWGLPKVGAVLDMRAQTISGDLDRARSSKAEADRAVAELREARAKAYAQSQSAIAEATRKAKEESAARAAEQDRRLDAQLAESEGEIRQARSAAMGAIGQVAGETANAVLARVMNGHVDEARVREAVGRILVERGLEHDALSLHQPSPPPDHP